MKENSCTLSEKQQDFEYQIISLIEDLGLSEDRNNAPPLHGDHLLLLKLLVERPTVFIAYAPYFNDNEIIVTEAINRGYCTLEHVSSALRNCLSVISAYERKRREKARFCKRYYIADSNTLSNNLDGIYSHLTLKEVQEDVTEVMALISEHTDLEDLCFIQEIAEGCFDYQQELDEGNLLELKYNVHLRMLINNILKEKVVLKHLKDFLTSATRHEEEEKLCKRAQKILDYFR